MKRTVTLILLLALLSLLSASFAAPVSAARETVVLNVYNWGEYLSDGSEESYDVNAEFEDWFNENLAEEYGYNIRVNYTTYASCEDMYNKLRSGAVTYDVIFPSDYMVERLINENMVLPLNFDNIPAYENIDPNYKNLYYDPDNTYSVPYMFGMVGVIYNSEFVDEEDLGSWNLLWNPDYRGKILQFNNPRDAFATAMFRAGLDVNSENPEDWEQALEALIEQKPLVQSYVMDEIYNKMKNGSAFIAAYYCGDFLTMYEDNDMLDLYYPEEGTNIYVDAMCIPSCSQHKEAAEAYINFLCMEDPAVANAEYTYYGSPNLLVRESEEYLECIEDVYEGAMELIYPEEGTYVAEYFHTLSDAMLDYTNELWAQLKIESKTETWITVFAGSILLVLFVTLGFFSVRKKIRERGY
ncbi:MAG: spermidine/putrescine ABC transporter substrate-binding protein [Clostridia bacterium]|nr:spermidine/putrescine ABC transporter substrate-binding protein [Clostridia bacterium]